MDWKLGGLILLAVAMPGTALAEGRFCVVTNYGESCYFYDANRCKEAAARQGGMCVINENKRANTSVLDAMNSVQEGAERGRRAGMEQREHNARVQLLEAQIAATKPQPNIAGPKVTYACVGSDGKPYEVVDLPILGCVVSGVDF